MLFLKGNKIKKIFYPFIAVTVLWCLLYFASCQMLKYTSGTEGIIEYDITYPDSLKDNFFASMMPSTMILKFKDNKTSVEFKVLNGVIHACFIGDPTSKKVITLFEVVGKKYAWILDSIEVDDQVRSNSQLKITFTDEQKDIAGFNCKKAMVINEQGINYPVYYTAEIKIKDPNWNTPYKEINGVLLEYRIKQKNIEMKLTATNVEDQKINDAVFRIPKGYDVVSKEGMPEIFQKFFL